MTNLSTMLEKPATRVSILFVTFFAMLQIAHGGTIAGVDFGSAYDDATLTLSGNNNTDANDARSAATYTYGLAYDYSNNGTLRPDGTVTNGYTLSTQYGNTTFDGVTAGKDSISLASKGNYVFTLAAVNLTTSKSQLLIDAPAGSNIVLIINGAFIVSNGSIVTSGGISSNNIVYRLANTTGTALISNGSVTGNILAPARGVTLSGKALIKGRVISSYISRSSDAVVSPEF